MATLTATLVAMAHTRLELLSIDIEEDRERMLSLLALALVATFLLEIGVILAAILLMVAFWDTYRLLVMGSLAGFFLAAGLAAGIYAVQKAKTKPRVFAASLSELIKDRQQLASEP